MKKNEQPKKKAYQQPMVKSEKMLREPVLNCPSTNVKYCGVPYSPKKG